MIGADVTLAVRNTAAAAPVVAELVASTGNPGVHVGWLDLTDRASITEFMATWPHIGCVTAASTPRGGSSAVAAAAGARPVCRRRTGSRAVM
jgi:hypothetical protein